MVIDSSIFIEHLRAKDKTQTTLANLSLDSTPYVTAVTWYELYMGATTPSKWSDVDNLLNPLPILFFDNVVASKAALIYQDLQKIYQTIDHRDIFIAATALVHNLPLKTLNIRHFNKIPNLIII